MLGRSLPGCSGVLFTAGVEGFEVFGCCGGEQPRLGADEDDLHALEHFAGDQGAAQLEGLGGAQLVAVEEFAGGLEDGGIKRLLDHAGSFGAQNGARGFAVLGGEGAGALLAQQGSVDFEGGRSGDQFAVVLDRLHEMYDSGGSRLLDEKFGEGRGIKEITAHTLPRSSSRTPESDPCMGMGRNRWLSSGRPASARLRRMVVVG